MGRIATSKTVKGTAAQIVLFSLLLICRSSNCVEKALRLKVGCEPRRDDKLDCLLPELPTQANLIVPGKSLGKLSIGLERKAVLLKMGTPDKREASGDWLYISRKTGYTIRIHYEADKISYIAFNSPNFRTTQGVNVQLQPESGYDCETATDLSEGNEFQVNRFRYLTKLGGVAFYYFSTTAKPSENINSSRNMGVVFEGSNVPEQTRRQWKACPPKTPPLSLESLKLHKDMPFTVARETLQKGGWQAEISNGKEITCGEGYDAVCSATFKKKGESDLILYIKEKSGESVVIGIDE